DYEVSATTDFAFDSNFAFMKTDDLARDVKAETQAAHFSRGNSPLKLQKNPLVVFGRDPSPVISNGEDRPIGARGDADLDRLTFSIPQSIGHQIRDDLLDSESVPIAYDRLAGTHAELDLSSLELRHKLLEHV